MRRAGPRDVDRVAALWAELSHYHAQLDARQALRPDAEAELRRLLALELRDADALALLYERAGDAAGLCMTRIQRAPIARESLRAEIGELFVRAELRRQGIGRALVEAALAWLRGQGVPSVVVRVGARNATGQAFWRAQGFGALMDVLERRL